MAWRSCTGCHELNEGHDTGPYSAILGCHLGNGCSECGGIGAIWDNTDYQAMADDMARSMGQSVEAAAPCTCPSGDGSLRHPCPMHPAADKAGGQQRAGDVDVDRLMTAAKGMTRLYSYVWDRADGCLVVFPENVRAFDAAFGALRMATGEAVDDATQAEQGERDAQD
ncbi:hypothetical protein WJ972_15605 [Achromobacter insuavis]